MFKIQKFEDAEKIGIPVDARRILKNDSCEIILITLKKGQEIAVHDNPLDVCFVAIEGKAILTLDEEKIIINPFDTVSISSGHQRGIKNVYDEIFRVTVIKKIA